MPHDPTDLPIDHLHADAVGYLTAAVANDPEVQLLLAQERLRVRLTDGMRQARQLAGLTQADLAARMGISQGRVSRLESVDSDRRLDSVVAHLHAVGADLVVALAFGETIIQVSRPDGYHVTLAPEPVVLGFDAQTDDDVGSMVAVDSRGEAIRFNGLDAGGDAYAYAA